MGGVIDILKAERFEFPGGCPPPPPAPSTPRLESYVIVPMLLFLPVHSLSPQTLVLTRRRNRP